QRPRIREAVDLQDVVERVLALERSALKRARVKATLTMPDDLPAVMGDPQELQQVVLNAIVNAIDAIEASGRPGTIDIRARRTDGHINFTVEDNGPGLTQEALDRIFEPFFTTKGDRGTGLGLTISLGLVKAIG